MNIGFIGLGKLGLDCAEVFAEKFTVRGYDIYPRTSNLVTKAIGFLLLCLRHMKKAMTALYPVAT